MNHKPSTNNDEGGPAWRHPDDAGIIAYLDGELSQVEREQTRVHLEKCWSCRSRLNAVQDSIETFLRLRRSIMPSEMPPAGPALAEFRLRLRQHISHPHAIRSRIRIKVPSWRELFLPLAAMVPWKHAKAAAAMGIAVFIMCFTVADPFHWNRVSADELLLRADIREQLSERPVDRVIRSVISVDQIKIATREKKNLGRIVLSQDNMSTSVYLAGETTSGRSLGQTVSDRDDLSTADPFSGEMDEGLSRYLLNQGWFPLVSVSEYRRLIAGRGIDGSKGSTVQKVDGCYEVHHMFAPGHGSGITEAEISLDASTYSPVSISFFATERGVDLQYVITRAVLEFLPRTPQIATLFRPVSDAHSEMVPSSVAALPQPDAESRSRTAPMLSPLNYFNSKATDAEASVALVLHRAGADLGEEINVLPMSDGTLLVQGLVDNMGRKGAITQALSGLGMPLRIQIYTPSDVRGSGELFPAPDLLPNKRPVEMSSGPVVLNIGSLTGESSKMAIFDQLYAHLSRQVKATGQPGSPSELQRRVAAFANEALNLSRHAVFHAWALKKLDVEFSTARSAGLSEAARQQVEDIRVSHRRAISDTAHVLDSMLSEYAPEGVPVKSEGRASEADQILQLAIEQNGIVRDLFTGSSQVRDVRTELVHLLTIFKDLQ